MNEKLSITLPSELVAVIKEQVDSGRYGSVSDVVRDALERQDWSAETNEPDIEFMREGIRQSLANPSPTLTVEEMRRRMKEHVSNLYKGR